MSRLFWSNDVWEGLLLCWLLRHNQVDVFFFRSTTASITASTSRNTRDVENWMQALVTRLWWTLRSILWPLSRPPYSWMTSWTMEWLSVRLCKGNIIINYIYVSREWRNHLFSRCQREQHSKHVPACRWIDTRPFLHSADNLRLFCPTHFSKKWMHNNGMAFVFSRAF